MAGMRDLNATRRLPPMVKHADYRSVMQGLDDHNAVFKNSPLPPRSIDLARKSEPASLEATRLLLRSRDRGAFFAGT